MGLPGDPGSARADQEVEVGAGVGLLHVVDVQALPTARPGTANAPVTVGAAVRRISSSSGTSSCSRRRGTSSTIGSPSWTSASRPPAAASGATCSTTVPYAVPLIRPSHTRTMSRTPSSSIFRGSGRFATSGMPG